MSTKYATLASQIVELVGGPANIRNAYHCQTRLRFELRDESKVDTAQLNSTEGVSTTRSSGGTFQVVIGTHVKDVFDEVARELGPVAAIVEEEPEAKAKRPHVVARLIDFISSTFSPIIPALAGAGMVSALLVLLVTFGWVSRESQTYVVISFIANSCFFFLPILLAFSAAGKLGTNRYLAAVVATMLVHPQWAALVAAGEPVTLFNVIPLTLATYSSTVIPVLLIVWAQSHVERLLNRWIPESIKIVVVPMLIFFIMGILAFSVLGPIGAIVGSGIAEVFLWLSTNIPWVPPLLLGVLMPIMVMFGIHTAVGPVGLLQLSQFGYDSIFGPGVLCSNVAQGVAAGVVAIRTKEAKFRQIATAGAITGLMGITEPALYGVNLPKRYPLIAAMIGGGAGGLYAGITATRRFAVGSSGLPAIPMYIGADTLQYFYNILIALGITIVVTALVAVVLSFRYEPKGVTAPGADGSGSLQEMRAAAEDATAPAGGVATLTRTTTAEVTSPVQGTIVPLEEIADAAFASGAMGPGVGVEPANGDIVAPVSGTVMAAMATGHAFGIVTDDGVEVLVHVGIDTVQMKGAGFTDPVAQGTRVQAGQRLVTADLAAIRAAGHPATVALIVTNPDKIAGVTVAASGIVVAGEPVLTLTH